MKYYNIIINLFQPLVENELSETESSSFMTAVQQTSKEAVSTARIRTETLFRIYYLRHGFDAMDAYLLHFLNTLGFMAMKELNESKGAFSVEDARCLLLMCALGLRDQGQYYHLVRTVFHLFRSRMSPEDIALLTHYVRSEDPEKDELHRPQDLISQYPLNITDISENPEEHRVTYLIKKSKNLSLEPVDADSSIEETDT
jgi:hypothetical protein